MVQRMEVESDFSCHAVDDVRTYRNTMADRLSREDGHPRNEGQRLDASFAFTQMGATPAARGAASPGSSIALAKFGLNPAPISTARCGWITLSQDPQGRERKRAGSLLAKES